MNVCITNEMWEKTCLEGHKLTRLLLCQRDTATELCWRKCEKFGDHTQIVLNYINTQAENKQIIGKDLPLELVFILGETSENVDTTNQMYFLGVLLLIAKKMLIFVK